MADQQTHIDVACEREADGWHCVVTVGDDSSATTHDVGVTDADVRRFAPGASVDRLVKASFEFLLEREPRESILRRFDLPVIAGYFPEYGSEISRRI